MPGRSRSDEKLAAAMQKLTRLGAGPMPPELTAAWPEIQQLISDADPAG
jgi:hypothetical protein